MQRLSLYPGDPEPKEFRGHLTLNISNDGLAYAADRTANRVHVFTKEGKFPKEFTLATYAGGFFDLLVEAVDSTGNIFTGGVFGGERVQKSIRVKRQGARFG